MPAGNPVELGSQVAGQAGRALLVGSSAYRQQSIFKELIYTISNIEPYLSNVEEHHGRGRDEKLRPQKSNKCRQTEQLFGLLVIFPCITKR
jgi:hypothetical protein